MKLHHLAIALCLAGASLLAQTTPAPKPVKPGQTPDTSVVTQLPAGVTVSDPAYLFSPEDKAKIRDIQYKMLTTEIEIQKMQVRIEQDKAVQLEQWNALTNVAYELAKSKGINLNEYEIDPAGVKLVKKKKP